MPLNQSNAQECDLASPQIRNKCQLLHRNTILCTFVRKLYHNTSAIIYIHCIAYTLALNDYNFKTEGMSQSSLNKSELILRCKDKTRRKKCSFRTAITFWREPTWKWSSMRMRERDRERLRERERVCECLCKCVCLSVSV